MKNILLATELGANSDRAMERALKLARNVGAQLHIIHVMPAYKDKKFNKSMQEDTEDMIRGYVYDYKDADHVKITIKALQSDTAFAEILDYAQKIRANLIVMGMHGKAKFRDLFVGTTIERVVRKGSYPVLLVKNKPSGPYQSILAGVDFAPASRAALRIAMELAPKGVFEVVHAYHVPAAYPTSAEFAIQAYEQIEKNQQKEIDAFIKTEISHFAKEHNGMSKRLVGKIIEGSVYKTMIKEAKNVKADLMTLGAHGRAEITFSRLGGAAADVLADPPCDVLVVRG